MSIKNKIITKNFPQTQKYGTSLAKKILKTKPKTKNALVLGLIGDLGGGKTTFLQGFAKGLGIKERILSPTFVIMKRFKIPRRKTLGFLRGKQDLRLKFQEFYHIDCYRIEKPKELFTLGFKEIISNPQNIVAIEWADKIKGLLPKDSVLLKFEVISKNKRKIVFTGNVV